MSETQQLKDEKNGAGADREVKYDCIEYCNSCGCKANKIHVKDCDSGVISEAETVCENCGHKDYWAFGFFESGSEMIGKAKKYTRTGGQCD